MLQLFSLGLICLLGDKKGGHQGSGSPEHCLLEPSGLVPNIAKGTWNLWLSLCLILYSACPRERVAKEVRHR